MPNISTLVDDIYGVFEKDVHVNPEDARAFGEGLARIVIDAVTERKDNHLRLSNLGNSCSRHLWYMVNASELAERMPGYVRIKFLIGHVTEAVVLFLARLAGHSVTDQQKTVDLHGVKGHLDARIDGELTDVKSASPYSYNKFKEGITTETDAFGYLTQLGSYAAAEGDKRGHFLAVDKVLGHLHLDTHDLPEVDYEKKISETRDILESNELPPRAFEDVPDGKSGNRKLGVKCSYCDYKFSCWPGVKQFNYARGPVYLTEVRREPRVERDS